MRFTSGTERGATLSWPYALSRRYFCPHRDPVRTVAEASDALERGVHPAALKDEVTTPAGCTIDGLMALEDGKLRVTLIKGVLAATERSKSLRSD